MLHSPRSTPAGIFYACHKTFMTVFWGDSFTNPSSRLIDRLHTYCILNVVLMQTLRKIHLQTACLCFVLKKVDSFTDVVS